MADLGVEVYIQPRAARTEVRGTHGGAIKIRVKAPPVDDAANRELVRFLAERLAVRASAVRIASGHHSRRKRVTVDGLSAAAVTRALGGAP